MKARTVLANVVAGLGLVLIAACVGASLLGAVALGAVAGVLGLLAGLGVWALSAPDAPWPGDWPQSEPAGPDWLIREDLLDADAQAFAVLVEQERGRTSWPEWPDAEVTR